MISFSQENTAKKANDKGTTDKITMFMAATLMALLGREKTGKGTMVRTSLLQSAIWCSATAVINAQPQYGKVYPQDRYQPWDPFSDYYQCKDGKYIGFMEKTYVKDRETFARIFDYPELLTDPDLDSLDQMREKGRVPEVTRRVEQAVLTRTSEEWVRIFRENDGANEQQFFEQLGPENNDKRGGETS